MAEIQRRSDKSHRLWWAAYIVLVLSLIFSTWALAGF
jgi:hypothetical protein